MKEPAGTRLTLFDDAYGPRSVPQQLLLFRLATTGDLGMTEVARQLEVNVTQVFLARSRGGKLGRAEVQKLRREME